MLVATAISRAIALQDAKDMVTPALEYFLNRIFRTLAIDVATYKTCRYGNPYALQRMLAGHVFVNQEFRAAVTQLGRFSAMEIDAMISDLPDYIIDVHTGNLIPVLSKDEMECTESFWKMHRGKMLGLRKLVQYCFTIAASSAAAERVFSILQRCFGKQQTLSLEDYVQLSIQLQYNKRNDY
jgi:hypothetical protein